MLIQGRVKEDMAHLYNIELLFMKKHITLMMHFIETILEDFGLEH